ncbi:DUF4249 family protein, partial [candidate division WOR-3 bacterium]|nr:DUF4249 family protein [candidate division WOR-3 bacterium]
MRLRIIPVIILLLSVIACDITPETYEGEPNIYAILSADSSFACIMVGKTTSVDDTLTLVPDTIMDTFWRDDTFEVWPEIVFPWNGVSGAEVSLKHGEESFSLTEDSTGYYSDSLSFHPGETWTLEVSYPTGEEITKETTIPGNFEITGFQTDTISTTDTLAWSKSNDAAGYLMKAFVWISWEDEDADTVYIDSAFTYPELLPGDSYSIPLEELYLWGDSLWFWVAALDTNAYDYRYYGEDR